MSKIKEISSILNATARSNKYRLSFTWPSGLTGESDLKEIDIICKAATAPQKEIGIIEVWNQGRKLVLPGDTTFDNAWSVDFYLGEDHKFRYDMIKWQDACDNFHTNIHSGNPEEVFADLKVEQLDSAGAVSAQYTLHGCFPTVVGEISYGDDSENTPVEFNVTFGYSDWVVGDGDSDNFALKVPTGNPTAL